MHVGYGGVERWWKDWYGVDLGFNLVLVVVLVYGCHPCGFGVVLCVVRLGFGDQMSWWCSCGILLLFRIGFGTYKSP